MKVYQIVEDYNKSFHAGSKATNDAVIILNQIGIEKLPITITSRSQNAIAKIVRQITFYMEWKRLFKSVEKNSIVIMQSPFTIRQIGRYGTLKKLKKSKNVRFISLIHDVELLRYNTAKSRKEFQESLVIVDQFIVHNDSMKNWFVNQGVTDDKLISLEIFDYLSEKSSDEPINYSKTVTVAGNLDKEKSPYVYDLGKIPNVDFELLGVNYTQDEEKSNVVYKGAFPPDDVPNELTHGFGLVWDGPSIETCLGETGGYLRFNNPHKLSLYLSSSLPVVIWSEAAEAEFVRKHQVGITVPSLYDLENALSQVNEADYQEMVLNTKKIKEKLQNGYYLKLAIKEAINRVSK